MSMGYDRSAGNDIIALAATDNDRTSLPRFYSRIVLPDELTRLGALELTRHPTPGLSFSSFIWLLWSIKESVYKYVSRADPSLRFAPLKIPVSRLMRRDNDFGDAIEYEGRIEYGPTTLCSRSFVGEETIMTAVSAQEDFSGVYWGTRKIVPTDYSAQSALVRKFALQSLSTVLPGAALRIIKTPDGPPEIWDEEGPLDIPVSLAHHGAFVAWCYRLPANGSYGLLANSSSYRKSAAN